MSRVRTAFLHICWIIRYGRWHAGWGWYEGKPRFGVFTKRYSGYYTYFLCLHVGPAWVSVSY
jgi:hypothetical protein